MLLFRRHVEGTRASQVFDDHHVAKRGDQCATYLLLRDRAGLGQYWGERGHRRRFHHRVADFWLYYLQSQTAAVDAERSFSYAALATCCLQRLIRRRFGNGGLGQHPDHQPHRSSPLGGRRSGRVHCHQLHQLHGYIAVPRYFGWPDSGAELQLRSWKLPAGQEIISYCRDNHHEHRGHGVHRATGVRAACDPVVLRWQRKPGISNRSRRLAALRFHISVQRTQRADHCLLYRTGQSEDFNHHFRGARIGIRADRRHRVTNIHGHYWCVGGSPAGGVADTWSCTHADL